MRTFRRAAGDPAAVQPLENSMSTDGSARYVDLNGKGYQEKPEYMTQLKGNILVPKTHPRIVLRGKFDTLVAKVLEVQITAKEEGYPQVVKDLDEIARFISTILMSEVSDFPMKFTTLNGMNADELRKISHHPMEKTGTDHMMPHYGMGKMFAVVNTLRAMSRETELQGVATFVGPDGTAEREDLLTALNRLSSAIYIIMCKVLGGVYKKGG